MKLIGEFNSRITPLAVEVWRGWIWHKVKFAHSDVWRGRFRRRDDAMIFANALEDYYSWKYRAHDGQGGTDGK